MITGISDRDSFARLRRTNRVGRCGPITIRYVPHDQHCGTDPISIRLAFSIGRRVGNAVVRNQLRRRLREIIAGKMKPDAQDVHPGNYLVITAPSAKTLSFTELEHHVAQALKRIAANGNKTNTLEQKPYPHGFDGTKPGAGDV